MLKGITLVLLPMNYKGKKNAYKVNQKCYIELTIMGLSLIHAKQNTAVTKVESKLLTY